MAKPGAMSVKGGAGFLQEIQMNRVSIGEPPASLLSEDFLGFPTFHLLKPFVKLSLIPAKRLP